MTRPDHKIIPKEDGETIALSPAEVERLEELGYRVLPPVVMTEDDKSGRRPCLVYFAKE